MSRMKVLFVLGSLGAGGTERQVVRLLQHLDRDRFDPRLYLVYRDGELLSQVPKDVGITSFWDRHTPQQFRWPGQALNAQARDIASIARSEAIDLLYDRTSQMTITTWWASRFETVPRVSVAVADPRSEFSHTHGRFAFAKRFLLRRAYRSAARVVGVSQGVCDGLRELFRLPPEQVVRCPNMFDIAALDREAAGPGPDLNSGAFHVVTVGGLRREKGHRFLVDAMAELVNRRRLDHVRLWMVGDGPEAAALRRQIDHRRLHEHVHLAGYQPQPLSWMRRAQLFCLPSLFEGMPNALVEAMICRTPVIASDCPCGPSEILQQGRWGKLVPTGDTGAWADAIEQVVRQPEAALQKVEGARRHIIETYSLQAGLPQWQELLLVASGKKYPVQERA